MLCPAREVKRLQANPAALVHSTKVTDNGTDGPYPEILHGSTLELERANADTVDSNRAFRHSRPALRTRSRRVRNAASTDRRFLLRACRGSRAAERRVRGRTSEGRGSAYTSRIQSVQEQAAFCCLGIDPPAIYS